MPHDDLLSTQNCFDLSRVIYNAGNESSTIEVAQLDRMHEFLVAMGSVMQCDHLTTASDHSSRRAGDCICIGIGKDAPIVRDETLPFEIDRPNQLLAITRQRLATRHTPPV